MKDPFFYWKYVFYVTEHLRGGSSAAVNTVYSNSCFFLDLVVRLLPAHSHSEQSKVVLLCFPHPSQFPTVMYHTAV